ncbi:hypothetical protein WJX72_010148 [[Myrmecia] bisecta]|uniref:Fe2OG dioxygenase domain-containing protein n=1 Tax=[Myrmecia] bisecta TaxID=41462 RepID=A0AAW1R9X7_9CHLO
MFPGCVLKCNTPSVFDHRSTACYARLSWALQRLGRTPAAAWVHAELMGSPPFTVVPGFIPDLRMADVLAEITLQRDLIVMADGRVVEEARETAWQSDAGLTFCYSGKEMSGGSLTPFVAHIRDRLAAYFGVYYDSVLINHYPDGKAGMRYHSDPLYGVWDSDTAVVSLGDTREFVFRDVLPSLGPPIPAGADSRSKAGKPWAEPAHMPYLIANGDVVRMFGDCQDRFQHCIKATPSTSRRLSITPLSKLSGTPRCTYILQRW